jgi:phosphate transport system permease protein
MRMPFEYLRGVRTLTTNIILEMGYVEFGSDHFAALIASGAVLFVFVLLCNLLFMRLRRA